MKLSSALWSNTALTRLNLNNCKLNDDAGAELGYMIVRNVSLTHLSCAWNLFGIKTAIAFQEGLANTRSACEWCVSSPFTRRCLHLKRWYLRRDT